ncbi:TPA: hypothetical protein HA278_01730 [Candidatus Woesearchaeota archaeon]|jgi:hypothetical protein|nr:hypothetical protein [Candidatus Woesearchaeota archaeon]
MVALKEQFAQWNVQLNENLAFIEGKLRNFKNLTVGEQVSYSSIGLGLMCILTSIVLFIL